LEKSQQKQIGWPIQDGEVEEWDGWDEENKKETTQ
jgi:hypothetical protein